MARDRCDKNLVRAPTSPWNRPQVRHRVQRHVTREETVMKRRCSLAFVAAFALAFGASGCGSSQSPTTATPAAPVAPPRPTVTSLSVTGPAPLVGATAQLSATA